MRVYSAMLPIYAVYRRELFPDDYRIGRTLIRDVACSNSARSEFRLLPAVTEVTRLRLRRPHQLEAPDACTYKGTRILTLEPLNGDTAVGIPVEVNRTIRSCNARRLSFRRTSA